MRLKCDLKCTSSKSAEHDIKSATKKSYKIILLSYDIIIIILAAPPFRRPLLFFSNYLRCFHSSGVFQKLMFQDFWNQMVPKISLSEQKRGPEWSQNWALEGQNWTKNWQKWSQGRGLGPHVKHEPPKTGFGTMLGSILGAIFDQLSRQQMKQKSSVSGMAFWWHVGRFRDGFWSRFCYFLRLGGRKKAIR